MSKKKNKTPLVKTREPGLDLLRCTAFFFVVLYHFFLFSGYHSAEQTGFPMVAWGGVRWLSVSCVGLFAMLSGYLKGEQSPSGCARSLAPVLVSYFLASALSIPVRHFRWGDQQSLFEWVQRLLSFRGVNYGWYAGMYVGLVAFMPLINGGLGALKTRKQMYLLAAGLLALTALPGLTKYRLVPDYWRICYPITYYVLGACVKRYPPKVSGGWWLGLALCLALALGGITTVSTDGKLSEAYTLEFGDLPVCALVVFLFLGLYRVKMPGWLAKGFAFAAGGCFGGYLLSPLVETWVYKLYPQWRGVAHFGKLLICGAVPVFLISLLSGKLVESASAWLVKKCRGGCLKTIVSKKHI